MFCCEAAQESCPGEEGSTALSQRVNETYLCGWDSLVWVFSLCRAPCCGVVWEVVYPHTSLLITTEHMQFCCKTKRNSRKARVELRVHWSIKLSSRQCFILSTEDVTFQQSYLSGTKKPILNYPALEKKASIQTPQSHHFEKWCSDQVSSLFVSPTLPWDRCTTPR